MKQSLIFTNDVARALRDVIDGMKPDRCFVVCDTNTRLKVLPAIEFPFDINVISIAPGDESKTLSTLADVWASLTAGGATRKSVVINIGGGVVTDLGGFAAATFKRGVRFVNVPTTLLGAVDAAVGGKTGINFCGYKNEIGAFAPASVVIVSSCFFSTLSSHELLSGYAEMLKHALLSGHDDLVALLKENPCDMDADTMLGLLRVSVGIKEGVVGRDPTEKGERKTLNLGHTVGHALESLALKRGKAVAHGYAVAWGLVAELVLSHMRLGFDSTLLHQFSAYVAQNYGAPDVGCKDYAELIEMMLHDKKNSGNGAINFTLLKAPGDAIYDIEIDDKETVMTALDIMRDLL